MADVLLPGLLKQRAVYWAPRGLSNSGQQLFKNPVEIKCFWVDQQKLYINSKKEMVVSRCTVLVDRDVEVGGYLWLGKRADLEDQDEPIKNKGANIIESYGKTPVPPSMKKFVRQAIC